MRHTFGYKRTEILAAFVNAAMLMAICLFLLKEAYERSLHPEQIQGKMMLIVAVVGLVANLISVLVLQKEKEHNMNTRADYLHLLGDTLSSVAVIAGGIAIWLYDLVWLDPLITALVSLYILYHTWGVLHEAVNILMQTAPEGVDIPMIIQKIEALEGVHDVHHLHLWQLNEEQIHFEAHIKVKEGISIEQLDEMRKQIQEILSTYGIYHSTLQIGHDCCEKTNNHINNNETENTILSMGTDAHGPQRICPNRERAGYRHSYRLHKRRATTRSNHLYRGTEKG